MTFAAEETEQPIVIDLLPNLDHSAERRFAVCPCALTGGALLASLNQAAVIIEEQDDPAHQLFMPAIEN